MAVSIRDDYPPMTRGGNTCNCCHAGQRTDRTGRAERVVDWDDHVNMEGFNVTCESCVREAARLLGMVDPSERDSALAEMHRLQRLADDATAEAAECRRLVDAIRGYDAKIPDDCLNGHDLKPLPDKDVLRCSRCGWLISGLQLHELGKPVRRPSETMIPGPVPYVSASVLPDITRTSTAVLDKPDEPKPKPRPQPPRKPRPRPQRRSNG